MRLSYLLASAASAALLTGFPSQSGASEPSDNTMNETASDTQTADETATETPPAAKRVPVEIEQVGRTRTDPYQWMKDENWQQVMRDPSVLKALLSPRAGEPGRFLSGVPRPGLLTSMLNPCFLEYKPWIDGEDARGAWPPHVCRAPRPSQTTSTSRRARRPYSISIISPAVGQAGALPAGCDGAEAGRGRSFTDCTAVVSRVNGASLCRTQPL